MDELIEDFTIMARNAIQFNGPQSVYAINAESLLSFIKEAVHFDKRNEKTHILHLIEQDILTRYDFIIFVSNFFDLLYFTYRDHELYFSSH